jgi:predicted PurR-regulated permease PerM
MNGGGNLSTIGRSLVTAAAFVVVIAGMKAAAPIIVPFLLSAFVAIICAPLLHGMQRQGVPTALAVLAVVLILIAIGILLVLFVGTSLSDFLSSIPGYQQRLQQQTSALLTWLADHRIELSADLVRQQFNPGTVMQMVANMLTSLTAVLANAFMILLTVVFILLEASGLPLKLRAAMGRPEASLESYKTFLASVNRYLVIKTVVSLLTGISVALWLTVLKIDYPLLWGLVAFLLNYIPNIGSLIAAIPAVLMGFIQYGFGSALLVAAGYLAVNTLFGNLVEPRVMGKGLGLSTLVVFVSLVFWGWVLGPIGMLLSVLLTMIVKIALESREDTRWIAVLLSSTPPAPPNET